MKVLVIAAHPDDDIFGCGGSIAKHVKNGNKVTIAYVTNGDAGDLKYTKEEMAQIRKKEAKEAANVLGVTDLMFLNFFDGYVEYTKELLVKCIELIRELKPDLIYLPYDKDRHRDHANTGTVVLEAIKRAAANSYQECEGQPWSVGSTLMYETWSPFEKYEYIEDITDFVETKLKAFKKHASQLQNHSYDEAIKGLNRYRGALSGIGEYCECFKIVKAEKVY